MKIVIFSSNTKHHSYFINQIDKQFDVCSIIYEKKVLKKNYTTGPFFKNETDNFENKFFESGISSKVNKKKLIEVYSVNNTSLAKYIEHMQPDIGITFGVGLVKPYIFNIPRLGTINIHRGNIHKYRGLDSDLWALYNKEYQDLGVALHCVDDRLDTGDLIDQKMIDLDQVKHIHEIRYYTTILATDMMIKVLNLIASNGKIKATQQLSYGDYYTAMSLDDKYIALKNFLDFKIDRNK